MSNRERERIHCRTVQAILYRSKANARQRFLLCILATWANDEAQCHPSLEQIAGLARLTTRHVQLILAQLVAIGELKIAYNASDYGTNVYTICCARPDYKPKPIAKKHPVKKQGVKTESKISPEVKKESPSNSVPVPDPISISEVHGEGNKHISKPKQAARSEIPAVSPPAEIQVLEKPPSEEQRQMWAREFFRIVRPEAYRLRLPLSKPQVRALRTWMNLGELPWPKPGSWLAVQMRRPI
ncbi:MAG: hypothetical protein PHC88_05395 [Terrimicrobiaceae bacterium]|nr:hypothetical protein [Terrimicrobiaceae bacterium]